MRAAQPYSCRCRRLRRRPRSWRCCRRPFRALHAKPVDELRMNVPAKRSTQANELGPPLGACSLSLSRRAAWHRADRAGCGASRRSAALAAR
eukprot:3700817-Prymnesium_polylepis.1